MTLRPSHRPTFITGAPSGWLTAAVVAGAVGLAAAGAATLGIRVFAVLGALLLAAVFGRHRTALLPAFLYIGIAKDNGNVLQSLPIDPTLVLAALLAGVCVYRLLNGKVRLPPPGFVLLLAVVGFLLVVGLAWTQAPAYGMEKTLRFLTLTLLAALSPFFIIESREDLRRFAGWTALAALAVGVGVLVHPPSTHPGEQGRLVLESPAGTIFLARLLVTGAFALLFAAVFAPPRRWRLLQVAAGLGLLVVAVGVGSRGPLVAFALTVLCIAAITIVQQPRRLLSLMVVVGLSVALFPLLSLPETSVRRLRTVATNPGGSLHHDARHAIYSQAIDVIGTHPLRGIGSGGYSIYASVVSESGFTEKYPHNIFLELWVELGVVPVLMLAFSVVYVLVALVRDVRRDERGRHLVTLFLGFLLINLFSSQFSGDINDNRTFWMALGLGWLLARYELPDEDAPQLPRQLPGHAP